MTAAASTAPRRRSSSSSSRSSTRRANPRHPYSLSAAPSATRCITVKDLSDASRRIAHVRPETRDAIEIPTPPPHVSAPDASAPARRSASPRCATCSRRYPNTRDVTLSTAPLTATSSSNESTLTDLAAPNLLRRRPLVPPLLAAPARRAVRQRAAPARTTSPPHIYICRTLITPTLCSPSSPTHPSQLQLNTHTIPSIAPSAGWSCCSATTPAATRGRSPSPPRLRRGRLLGSSGSSGRAARAAVPQGATAAGTYTGDSVMTRWGAVQVEITVADGKITAVQAVGTPEQRA